MKRMRKKKATEEEKKKRIKKEMDTWAGMIGWQRKKKIIKKKEKQIRGLW